MNSSWLFRTCREGETRLRAEQNIFHVTVYGEKEEAVVKARPYCMQSGMEWEHAEEQTNIQTGTQPQVLMMALRLAGPQVPRSETKGSEPNDHKGPFFPPQKQEPQESSGLFSTSDSGQAYHSPCHPCLVPSTRLSPLPCWFGAS